MKKDKTQLVKILLVTALSAALLTGCGVGTKGAVKSSQVVKSSSVVKTEAASLSNTGSSAKTAKEGIPDIDLSGYDLSQSKIGRKDKDGLLEIKAIADLTPHSELLTYVEPALEKAGLKVDLVSTAADSTTLEKTENGEIDFSYFGHWPYIEDENKTNGFHIANAGNIHIEPIRAYSDKYKSADEIKEGDTVAIPNDVTNEYRALKILSDAGLIKLKDGVDSALAANVDSITENPKKLNIVELDSAQIIPTKDDYDFFITNTNKALEAGIKSNVLFSEKAAGNPFANVISVTEANKDDPAIQMVVAALRSDATKAYIKEHYNGAVIPAE